MPQSLAKILVHLIFSTKNRRLLLPHDPYEELHKYARGIFVDQKCHMIEMNNVEDHVHILFDLHRTEALSDVVMHVKKGTSRWLKEQSAQFQGFEWQDGYGAFSLTTIAEARGDPLPARPAGPSSAGDLSGRAPQVSARL